MHGVIFHICWLVCWFYGAQKEKPVARNGCGRAAAAVAALEVQKHRTTSSERGSVFLASTNPASWRSHKERGEPRLLGRFHNWFVLCLYLYGRPGGCVFSRSNPEPHALFSHTLLLSSLCFVRPLIGFYQFLKDKQIFLWVYGFIFYFGLRACRIMITK